MYFMKRGLSPEFTRKVVVRKWEWIKRYYYYYYYSIWNAIT